MRDGIARDAFVFEEVFHGRLDVFAGVLSRLGAAVVGDDADLFCEEAGGDAAAEQTNSDYADYAGFHFGALLGNAPYWTSFNLP